MKHKNINDRILRAMTPPMFAWAFYKAQVERII